MKKFLLSDVFFGAVLTLLVAGFGGALLEPLELKFYDFRAKFRQDLNQPKEVAIIAIDDDSVTQLGRLPWPRSRIATMVDKLNKQGAKVIGLNLILSEPDHNPGIDALDKLATQYKEFVSSGVVVEKGTQPEAQSPILSQIDAAKQQLDEDAKLAAAIKDKRVVLPMFFTFSANLGAKPEPLPPEIARSAMTLIPSQVGAVNALISEKATAPLSMFSSAAAGVGHINVYPDPDGSIRRAIMGITYADALYPTYALEVLRVYLNLEPKDVSIMPGQKVMMGQVEAPLDPAGLMNITYRGPRKTFFNYSFADVFNDKVVPDVKDRIVLLGATATGSDTPFLTPAGPGFPSMEIVANVIENLLNKKFLVRPSWAIAAEFGLILLVGVFISFLLPRLKAGMGAIVSAVLLLVLLTAGTWLFVSQSQWLRLSYPAVLLAAGYTVIVSKRFLTTEKRKELVEASQIETNKMLGLSFQGQGMLDLAFEKFRACPMDEALAELLYNLGLDFERKRQYNKAVAVYEYVGTKFKGYKDTVEKLATLRKASDGAVFGGSVGRGKDATIMTEGAGMKPTLGRYEVEKELGRGAMGIVYLGRDPKINRQVAIKTMMLELEGTPEQVKELKMRFFREAESAGNLNHPNIVRIFDAGEENEIAYIAMELLEGHDLKRYCDKASLLPLQTVLDYCAKTADGLDYAHISGVIHRDVKPANIMLLKDGSLRITDFGIARITQSSKTATGTVMGTPSYMSPEQVSGKKVDGRADLWSLGVMLYEMSTGEKPFRGGDAIGTLLFQIANDTPTPPTEFRPDLPSDVAAIIDKCLEKNPDNRYQRGMELAVDLRKAIERLKSGAPPPPVTPKPGPVAPAAAAAAALAFERTAVLESLARQPESQSTGPDGTLRIEPPGSKK